MLHKFNNGAAFERGLFLHLPQELSLTLALIGFILRDTNKFIEENMAKWFEGSETGEKFRKIAEDL